jgi:hypothetical protein
MIECFVRLQGIDINHHGDSVSAAENLTRPRHIKSHLPVFLLPDEFWEVKPKVVKHPLVFE